MLGHDLHETARQVRAKAGEADRVWAERTVEYLKEHFLTAAEGGKMEFTFDAHRVLTAGEQLALYRAAIAIGIRARAHPMDGSEMIFSWENTEGGK